MIPKAWSFGTALLALAAGCSDPVPPAPRGNVNFSLQGCTTYSGAIGVNRNEQNPNLKLQDLAALDGTQPGRRLEDGQEGARVRCSVDGGSTNAISASISGIQSHPSNGTVENVAFSISDAYLQKMETTNASGETVITGEGLANYIAITTGGVTYESVGACTLTINSSRPNSQFTVDAGRVYARFDCPQMTDPPVTGCRSSGAFVFERCKED